MYARIHALADRMNGNVVGIVGILTTLLLLSAACMAALDLASFSPDDGPTAGATLGTAMFAGMLIFGLVIVAPLVGALSLFFLLKRYSAQIGPLFHIEQTAAPAVVVGPYTSRHLNITDAELESLADAVERKRRLEGQVAPVESVAESFDFGLSFADELNAQRSQANRQGEAVLAQLFADNLSLHERIGVDNISEKGQEVATELNHSSDLQHADATPTTGDADVVW